MLSLELPGIARFDEREVETEHGMWIMRHRRGNPDTELCRSLPHRATSRLYPELLQISGPICIPRSDWLRWEELPFGAYPSGVQMGNPGYGEKLWS